MALQLTRGVALRKPLSAAVQRVLCTKTSAPSVPSAAPTIANYLGFGGAIPFVAGSISALVASDPAVIPIARAVQLYGASILSFLGAVHWGAALRAPTSTRESNIDFAYSVVPSLVGWGASMMEPAAGLAVLAPAFVSVLVYDSARFGSAEGIPAWYVRLRRPLSAAAVVSMGVTFGCVTRAGTGLNGSVGTSAEMKAENA